MAWRVRLAFVMVLLAVGAVHGDQVTPPFGHVYFGEIALGKGARAWGMGGAQIALGADPEAAGENPAALALVARPVPTFSFVHENLRLQPRTSEVAGTDLAGRPVTAGKITGLSSGSSGLALGRLAFAYPFPVGRRTLVAAVSYERRVPFSLSSTYAFDFRGTPTSYGYHYGYEAEGSGGLDALSLSAATDIVRGWTVGLTLHRWLGAFTIPVRERYDYRYDGTNYSWTEELRDDLRFHPSGVSVEVGTQIAVKGQFFAGLVYKSGINARVDYSNRSTFTNTDLRQIENLSSTLDGQGTLRLPSSIGLGLGVQPYETLTLAFDYIRTGWSHARLENYARGIASGGAPLPGTYLYPTMTPPDVWAQHDTHRAHLGVEYVLHVKSIEIPLRAGTYWADLLAFDEHFEVQASRGFTAGAGVMVRGVGVDVAWVRQKVEGTFVRDSIRTSLSYGF